jgi:hypothetical protein
MHCYYYLVCLANYGASETVKLQYLVGTWRNPPNIRNKTARVILENEISCSLTVVCASSFRPSQAHYFTVPSIADNEFFQFFFFINSSRKEALTQEFRALVGNVSQIRLD